MSEDSRSRRLAEAGFTARDRRLACDECGGMFTAQLLPIHKCPGVPLWERLHSLSKVLESSGRIDESEHPGAYATVLDAMNAVRKPADDIRSDATKGEVAVMRFELAALKLFALAMLEHWPLGDVDGGELQDKAVQHGLLVPERRTEPCSEEGCNCAEYYSPEEWGEGITCYRRAPWLKEGTA